MRAARATAPVLVACAPAGCRGVNEAAVSSTEKSAPPVARPTKGAAPWPAPANAVQRAQVAGVPVDRFEYGVPGHPGTHIHAHLDVFVNRQRVRVPPGLGIDITVPGVQKGQSPDGTPAYGGISLCARDCIAALHTHDDSGVLHVESKQARTYHLGDVFKEWNVRLDRTCVGGYCRPDSIRVFANGDPFAGDPAQLALKDKEEVAIVIGPPPAKIPSSYF